MSIPGLKNNTSKSLTGISLGFVIIFPAQNNFSFDHYHHVTIAPPDSSALWRFPR